MVSPRRALAEARREFLRPISLWTVPAVLGFCLMLGYFSVSQHAFDLYPPGVYLLVPMFALPLAAHRATQDRERDLAAAHATTPLTVGEVLLGKLAGLSFLLALVLVATAPLLFAMVNRTATGALLQFSPWLAWGGVVGLVALVVGLGVGFSLGPRGASALSIGFGVVGLWFLVAVLRHQILGLAGSELAFQVLEALVHASPFTWGVQALAPDAPYLLPGHLASLRNLGLLLAALLAILGALVVGYQRIGGWRAGSPIRPVAGAVLVVGFVATGVIVATAEPVAREPEHHPAVAEAMAGEVHVQGGVVVEGGWSHRTPATVHLTFTGHPNATVAVGDVEVRGESFSAADGLDAPAEVVLDHIIPAPEHAPPQVGEQAGTAHVPIPVVLTAHRMDVQPVLHVALSVEGEPVVLSTQQSASQWQMPLDASMLTGGVTLGLASAFAFFVPRRLNRW